MGSSPAFLSLSEASETVPRFSVTAAINVAVNLALGWGMTNPEKKLPVALIAGPTASGKTALALHLATTQNVAIINADSAQVYAELPVLSAQPTPTELASAPHALFGYRSGAQACSAADWAADAKAAIVQAHAAGQLPVLVGGTGLYMRTLLNGIAPIPAIDPVIRANIRALKVADAFAALHAEDPAAAAALGANDDSRIKRALEVIRSTRTSILEWRAKLEGGIGDKVAVQALLLLPPRDWLHSRCDRRFAAMMKGGAIEEVAALMARAERGELPADAPVLRAIGVPEIAAMLAGELSEAEALERGQAATRQYAKRQYTWFRNQSPAEWLRWEKEINVNNLNEIAILLQY